MRRALALIALTTLVPASAAPPATPTPRFDLERPEIGNFIDDVSKRDKIRAKTLTKLLGKAAVEQAVRAARAHDLGPGAPTNIPVQVVTKETVEAFLRDQ